MTCTGIVRFLPSFAHSFIHQTSMEYQLSIALSHVTPKFSSLNDKQVVSLRSVGPESRSSLARSPGSGSLVKLQSRGWLGLQLSEGWTWRIQSQVVHSLSSLPSTPVYRAA